MASSVASASDELLEDELAEPPRLLALLLAELLLDELELPPDVWFTAAGVALPPVWLVEPS